MELTKYQTRQRVNFTSTVKGLITVDCTIEIIDAEQVVVLQKAEELLKEALKIAQKHSQKVD